MSEDDTYELYIDAFTPASIPMSRLAEYMGGFAVLLGYEDMSTSTSSSPAV